MIYERNSTENSLDNSNFKLWKTRILSFLLKEKKRQVYIFLKEKIKKKKKKVDINFFLQNEKK